MNDSLQENNGMATAHTSPATLTVTPALTSSVGVGTPTAPVPLRTVAIVDTAAAPPWYFRPEVGGLVAPFVALVVAILAAYFALRNGLRLQRENKRNELKLEVYKEFGEKISQAHEAVCEVQFYIVFAAQEAESAEYNRNHGILPGPLKHNGKEFVHKFTAASQKVADVMMLIERYLIIEPDLDIFKLALNCAVHDAQELNISLSKVLFKWYPIPRPQGSQGPEYVNVKAVPKEVIEPLLQAGWHFHGKASNISSYLEDLRREIQILLLRGLFDGIVPRRQPIDPELRVVTLDKSELPALRKYFNDETAWGKQAAQTEREVRERFSIKSGAKPA